MNRQEKADFCIERRKEIDEEINEHQNIINEHQKEINKLKQEYEVLGDYASKLLREEEQDRKKQKYNYERGI